MNGETLKRGLGIFIEAMRQYMVSVIERNKAADKTWDEDFETKLEENRRYNWQMKRMQLNNNGSSLIGLIDYNTLISFMIGYKNAMMVELRNQNNDYQAMRSCFQELVTTRNKSAHFDPSLDEDEMDRAFSNMRKVAKILEMTDLRDELLHIEHPEPVQSPAPQQQPARNTTTTTSRASFIDDTNNYDRQEVIPAWFNQVRPQFDIRNGVLDESVFAANLEDVAHEIGPEVYSNYSLFFDKTYITLGLKELARRVVQALNGVESENRAISLQTGFGGGKTHSLIALYHIVKNAAHFKDLEVAHTILNEEDMPNFSEAKVAVFTNNTVDVAAGRIVEADGITIHTLWGELAYQLGGREAYERVRQSDEQCIAPAGSLFKPILKQAVPSLILIDELADYCNKATGKRVGDGTLFTQTNSFMQTLTEMVASVPRCFLICTLPASGIEVATSDIGTEIINALESRFIRIGAGIKPVDNEEIFEVIRRRLFEYVGDPEVINAIARKYNKMYSNCSQNVPVEAARASYAERIRKSYPFHPELIDMFHLRWASDSNFQRTRGVLRLLASIVKDLWSRRQTLEGTQALIQTSDVNLANLPTLQSTITNLMGSQWDSVMHADVYGASSNAVKIDEDNATNNVGKFRLAEGVATTVLLASIGVSAHKGLTMKEIKLCMLRPASFQHIDIDGTVRKMEDVAHYMYRSEIGNERSFWFNSKPNINILINQAKANVRKEERNAVILSRLNEAVRGINDPKVLIAPTDDLPEQHQLTFVVLRPEYALPQSGNITPQMKQFIESIAFMHANTQRVFRNTILYLACTEIGRSQLEARLSDFLACNKVLQEAAGQIDSEQEQDIIGRRNEYDRQVRDALIRAYSVVIKCSRQSGLMVYSVGEFATSFALQIQDKTLDALYSESAVLRRVGMKVISNNNLEPTPGNPIKVKDFYEAFLRYDDKPMIRNAQAIIETVNRYCEENLFAVAVGTPGNFTKLYKGERVPFLDVNDELYWMVDNSFTLPTEPEPNPEPGPEPGPNPQPEPGPNPEPNPNPGPKTYRKVTISGDVPLEQWTQLFPSFVNTLKKNRLKISVTFVASSTAENPLSETSATYKSVKESASQLGLNFEPEE